MSFGQRVGVKLYFVKNIFKLRCKVEIIVEVTQNLRYAFIKRKLANMQLKCSEVFRMKIKA